jgi:hypothetical protein
MAKEYCWAIAAGGLRCQEPSTAGDYYCIVHGFGTRPKPHQIWREPVCEMPPGLVVLIRADDPDAVFPEPPPEPEPLTAAEPPPPLPPAETAPDPAPPLPACAPADPAESPLAWLLAALQTAVQDVMASEATPLQKANAVSRLGGLYLKTYRATELQKENRELHRRAAELEAQLVTAAATAARMESLSGAPDASRRGAPPPVSRAGAPGGSSAGSSPATVRGPASRERRHARKR